MEPNSNKKTFIAIFIVVVLVAIVAGLVYYFYFMKGGTTETTPPPTELPIGGQPIIPPVGFSTTPTTGTGQKVVVPRLRQITSEPVGGAGIASSTIRYIQRADGNIFETKTDSLTNNRISNKTVPKIYEAYWANLNSGKNGADNIVVTRQLKDDNETIETFVGKLSNNASSTEVELGGVYLPQNVYSLAISPDKTKMFYTYPTASGVSGVLANSDGNKKSIVFESSSNEWLTGFADSKTVVLTTKPSAFASGFAYFLNTVNGDVRKFLGNIDGLTVLVSSDKKLALYSWSMNDSFQTKVYNFSKNSSSDFSLQTLPEKCAWSKEPAVIFCAVPEIVPAGIYPDDWYQSKTAFTDDIWKININTGETRQLISPLSFSGKQIDVINLILNQDETFLLFTNKTDLSLWVLDIR